MACKNRWTGEIISVWEVHVYRDIHNRVIIRDSLDRWWISGEGSRHSEVGSLPTSISPREQLKGAQCVESERHVGVKA